jgi:tetratricopeptide (TPR) repeat protein
VLRWAFDQGGDGLLGAEIAAYSGPLWLRRGLLLDCRSWMAKAASACIGAGVATSEHALRIQNTLALAEQFTNGLTEGTAAALASTSDRAEDPAIQFKAHLGLWGGHMRAFRSADALASAETCAALAERAGDQRMLAVSAWMLGHSKHHAGRFEEARDHLLRHLELDAEAARVTGRRAAGYDRRTDALTSLAHTARALGQLEQAASWSREAIAAAQSLELAVPLVVAMASILTHTLLVEPDTNVIDRDASELFEQAQRHSIHSDAAFAVSVKGLCQARRGEFDAGARLVQEGLRGLGKEGLEALVRAHICEIAIEAGRLAEASYWAPRVEPSDQNKQHWCFAEVLRVKGVLEAAHGRMSDAEAWLLEALELARRQKALFWELRVAISLSRWLASQGREAEALASLELVYARFSEGHGAADMRRAKCLIEELKTSPRSASAPT